MSTPSAFEVRDGAGWLSNPAGTSRQAYLLDVASLDSDVRLTLSNDKLASGSGLYTSVVARSVAGSSYRAVLRSRSNGQLSLRIDRGSSTIAAETVASGLTAATDRQFEVRVQAVGSNPTTVRAKVWQTGSPEPSTWLRSVVDATANMQQPGGVGIDIYLSSSASNGPITTAIHDLIVTAP